MFTDGKSSSVDSAENEPSTPGSSSAHDPGNPLADMKIKSRRDFMNEIILRQANRKLPENLLPAVRTKIVEQVLNDKNTRHRFVFSSWPRPPGLPNAHDMDPRPYDYITPENSLPGKMAPNNVQLWGATLFDFHWVMRIPHVPNLATISTGSKLAQWAEAHGEANGPAKSCIEWADREANPEVIPVYGIEELIKEREKAEYFEEKNGRIISIWPEKTAFDSNGLQRVTEPFSDTEKVSALQEYIPQSNLPRKLLVHDPWKLLNVRFDDTKGDNTPWNDKVVLNPESTYTYNLKLSEVNTERREDEEEELAKSKEHAKQALNAFLANPHSSLEKPRGASYLSDSSHRRPGPAKPPIYVILPASPPLVAAKEAHLYISPAHSIGRGNHSFVYDAEWEVPRSFLVKEVLCKECIQEDLIAIIKEEDGEDGAKRKPEWDILSGKMVAVKERKDPQVMTAEWEGFNDCVFVLKDGWESNRLEYEGPYRVVHSRVKYQNLEREPYCEHLTWKNGSDHPLTTKVRVAAKLSIQHDTHLEQEAENYQQFPKHFFEHWSGYNILSPIHDPTPVGPLVPQFYGYYVPDESDELKEEERAKKEYKAWNEWVKERAAKATAKQQNASVDNEQEEEQNNSRPTLRPSYLSPILLIEHCGRPIKPNEMSIDDKQECVALGLRLHEAAWFHGSFAQRNILVQPGPLSKHPDERRANTLKRGGYGEDWSFRLIDFGRSCNVEENSGRARDELEREHQNVRGWFGGFQDLN